MDNSQLRDIKTKKPWVRIQPRLGVPKIFSGSNMPSLQEESNTYQMVSQGDFLREFYPTGHKINDEHYYPDVYRQEVVGLVDDNGNPITDANGNQETKTEIYCEKLPRYSFAFQQVIMYKQLTHLCGNDIQFDHTIKNPTKEQQDILEMFHEGWLEKDMEIANYDAAKSVKGTGDGAFVGYINKGVFGWRVFSAFKGDTLYPHYNHDGTLALFARSFSDYDDEGNVVTNWLEVWDEKFLYRYKQDVTDEGSLSNKIKSIFGISGYKLVEYAAHGFPFIPVAYMRDDNGACWSASQDSIDCYEMSFSQMAHNNQLYGEPTMYLQGENVEAIHDMNGTLRMLTMGPDDKAGYLSAQSAADSYMKQLELNYKMIYEQSFAVIPPQISGNSDISGAAIKILYSPAVEKAMADANDYQPFVNVMVKIFAFGYGMEKEKSIDFTNLPIHAWIKPFVHVNESTVVNDMVQAISAGFLSKQTASERISFYAQADEWDRIIREAKEEQQADLLYQIKASQASTDNNEEDNKNNEE